MRARTGTPCSIYSITNSKVHVILLIIDAFSYCFNDADASFMLI